MSFGLFFKFLHVLAAILYVSGVVGRGAAFWQAARASQVETAAALLKLSDFFERIFVIPGSMAVLLFGIVSAWVMGWPLFGFLQGSSINWLLVSLVLYLSLIPPIPLYLIPRRKQREQLTSQALAQGQITPELTAALNDRGVNRFRAIEMLITFVITAFMVLKPF